MYDIKPLEREWKNYRKKKLKPWFIIASIIFIILSVSAMFLLTNTKIEFPTFDTSFMKTSSSSSINDRNLNYPSLKVKSNVLVNDALEKLEIEKSVTDNVSNDTEESTNTFVDIPILDGKNQGGIKKGQRNKPKIHLDIIETSSISAYKDVEKRFLQSHDTDDSLFLARSYYNKGNYKKSEHWALQTNKVNANIEESIFIFVKSKIKLGRKNEAMSILRSYIKKSHSQEAKKLLYRIENNKL